jgi:hypothetical protein
LIRLKLLPDSVHRAVAVDTRELTNATLKNVINKNPELVFVLAMCPNERGPTNFSDPCSIVNFVAMHFYAQALRDQSVHPSLVDTYARFFDISHLDALAW